MSESKVCQEKRSREIAPRREVDSNPVWSLNGMDETQAVEALAIKERVDHRPRRAQVSFSTAGAGRTILVGRGTKAHKTLQSMRLYEASGSASREFANDLLRRLSETLKLTGDDARDSEMISAAVALIAGIAPQNELEATMALQMVAANEAALQCFARSRKADFMEHAAGFSNMANKAMRSFAMHAEALAKLRRGGEQVVKHVHVNEGGQAVIAQTVNTGGGGER